MTFFHHADIEGTVLPRLQRLDNFGRFSLIPFRLYFVAVGKPQNPFGNEMDDEISDGVIW